MNDFDKSEVQEEAEELLKLLRKQANGILLNFIQASEMDFSVPYPKFPNGEVSGRIRDIPGPFDGSIRKQATVQIELLNPDEKRLNKLMSSNLETLGVSRVIYSFLLSPPISNLPQYILEQLQANYVILGWEPDSGAEIEMPDDLKLSVSCTEESITIAIETKYQFQFEKRAKGFLVRNFVEWLLKGQ